MSVRTRTVLTAAAVTAALSVSAMTASAIPVYPKMRFTNDPKSYASIDIYNAYSTTEHRIYKGQSYLAVDQDGEARVGPWGGSYRIGEVTKAYGGCTLRPAGTVNPPSDWRDNGTKVITYRNTNCTN